MFFFKCTWCPNTLVGVCACVCVGVWACVCVCVREWVPVCPYIDVCEGPSRGAKSKASGHNWVTGTSDGLKHG